MYFHSKIQNSKSEKYQRQTHTCTCMYVVAQSFKMIGEILKQKKLIRFKICKLYVTKPSLEHPVVAPGAATAAALLQQTIQNTDVHRFVHVHVLQRPFDTNMHNLYSTSTSY